MLVEKTYMMDVSLKNGMLWSTLTVTVFDEPEKKEREPTKPRGLFLHWNARPGCAFVFDSLRVAWPNMPILIDTELLRHFTHIRLDTQPQEVRRWLQRLGFGRKEPLQLHPLIHENVRMVSALAQDYDIEAVAHGKTLMYLHDGNSYPERAWATPPDEEHMREYLRALVGESGRRRFEAHASALIPRENRDYSLLGAYYKDLLERASDGDENARQAMIEKAVTHVKEAYGGIRNLVLLQRVREGLVHGLDEALTEAPSPFAYLDGVGSHVVRTVSFALYTVLQGWQCDASRLHGSVLQEVMEYSGDLDDRA